MAFELIATGSKKWADYQQQNNPLAAGYNVIKAKGMDFVGINGQPATFNLVVTYTKATPLFEISDNELSANEVEYYNVRVVDESGNEAVGQLDVADPSTAVAIDISNLNVNEVLTAFVSIGSSYSPQLREMPNIEFPLKISEDLAAFEIGNKVTQGAIAATFDELTAANGGTVNLPAASVGDTVQGAVVLAATLGNVKVTSIVASGDGVVVAPAGYTPFNIEVDAISPDSTFLFALDTATAGAKSMTITIISDATVSPYTFDVALTVA